MFPNFLPPSTEKYLTTVWNGAESTAYHADHHIMSVCLSPLAVYLKLEGLCGWDHLCALYLYSTKHSGILSHCAI